MSALDKDTKDLLESINKKLQRLEAVNACKDLISTYARACDRGNDYDLLKPLFTEDATWYSQGFGDWKGPEEVAGGLNRVAGQKIWWCLHYMISPQVTVSEDGKSATAVWYLWEPSTIPNSDSLDAEPHWTGGTYKGSMREVDGTWLFSSINLTLNMMSPYSSGWVEQPYPNGNKRAPWMFNLQAGTYHWCSCGKSKNQPFCDGSHKDTNKTPILHEQEDIGFVSFCGCKFSKNKPYCDGSHLRLFDEKGQLKRPDQDRE